MTNNNLINSYAQDNLKSVYLDKDTLSPDPTYNHELKNLSGNNYMMYIYPYQVIDASPFNSKINKWMQKLNMFEAPSDLLVNLKNNNQFRIIIDFGTELDGTLEIEVKTTKKANLVVLFGESIAEVTGLVPVTHPSPAQCWHISQKGMNSFSFKRRGFRYVNLLFTDLKEKINLKKIVVKAEFTFNKHKGDFICSDKKFQRVWQSSAYTARLCTKENDIWDGIKRGRSGWYGDARITKEAIDNVFFEPASSENMLLSLKTNEWPTGVPVYAFDAISMLKQHILTYGLERSCIKEIYKLVKELLGWIKNSQTNEQGFLTYTETYYFHNIGFLDWSKFPSGGKFEELSWLQIKYIEGLRDAAQVAEWLRDHDSLKKWSKEADILENEVIKQFWQTEKGFIHTLNQVDQDDFSDRDNISYKKNEHYQKTYVEKIKLGPSGASRQANSLALFGGICTPEMKKIILEKVFNNQQIYPIISPYFAYYEQSARARCGDTIGAINNIRHYIGNLLEEEDSATVWEMYNPEVQDLRKYFTTQDINHQWPVSLCHGWGSGAVPITTKYLLGIIPESAGFKELSIKPNIKIPWTLAATVPTKYGLIKVTRDEVGGKINYSLPKEIIVNYAPKSNISIQRR